MCTFGCVFTCVRHLSDNHSDSLERSLTSRGELCQDELHIRRLNNIFKNINPSYNCCILQLKLKCTQKSMLFIFSNHARPSTVAWWKEASRIGVEINN